MTTPPAAPDPAALVASFAHTNDRFGVYTALQTAGPGTLDAVRAGLRHANWHVRHWCAIYLDRHSDAETLRSLLPLLHDPVAKVRLWAVHSLACQHCKDHACPVDVVPLLIERILHDPSTQVRKMAVTMLADAPPDPRVVPVLEAVLAREQDRKLRLHAERGLRNYRAAGKTTAANES